MKVIFSLWKQSFKKKNVALKRSSKRSSACHGNEKFLKNQKEFLSSETKFSFAKKCCVCVEMLRDSNLKL